MSEDINQELLAESRKLTSLSRRMFYLVLFLLIFAIIFVPVSRPPRTSSRSPSWEQVTTAMRQQDFPKALSVAQALVARQPNYYYGQVFLGAIYLAMGDVTNAEVHYLRAYELFPNEQSDKDLAAVRKRLADGRAIRLLSK